MSLYLCDLVFSNQYLVIESHISEESKRKLPVYNTAFSSTRYTN